MMGELGAAAILPLVRVGDELGLYTALADGPATSAELAARSGCAERYLREWLSAHAAAGYVDYEPGSGRFSLNEEQAAVFADEGGPAFMLGAFETIWANAVDAPKVVEAFRTGRGVGWHEHHRCLFSGVERFFRPGYNAHLTTDWLPALDGAVARLERGARVADIGCGHGASTLLMAKAFPRSTFVGFDYHAESIERARKLAREEAAGGNLSFETASAKAFPGAGYDLVTCFDCLHDMGDPVGAAAHIRGALAPDGWLLLVEPFAGDRLEDNLNPVGRLYYAASTMICTPASLSQEVGLGLGAQAGEARLRDVLGQAGFNRVRRAAATPFNLILEARP
jgi:SAM-dependent methyltransferase